MDVIVEPLGNHPELIPVAAEWHFREWGHTDPGGSLEAWTAGMARQAGADAIPGTLIALADGTPAGVVCLVARDMPGYEPAAALTPWIKGLYVVPSQRRRGIGGILVRRCEAWAASLGHQVLYLYTERDSGAQALYKRLGWQTIDTGYYDGIDVTVMRSHMGIVPGVPKTGGRMFGLSVRFTCRDAASAEAFDNLVAETVPRISQHEPGTLVYAVHAVEGKPLERIFYELSVTAPRSTLTKGNRTHGGSSPRASSSSPRLRWTS
jgi:GNAT superfamily N-acetyltransferase